MCLKSSLKNQTTESLAKHTADTYWAAVFAPDYSATILMAKICTNHPSVLTKLDFYAINRHAKPQISEKSRFIKVY